MNKEDTLTDPNFRHEVAARPGGENIMLCYACGTCTAACPVAEVEPQFDPRRIIRSILLGLKKEVLMSNAIWFCAQCHTCSARCPQNVRFREIVRILWQMAVEEGYARPNLPGEIEELNRAVHRWRRSLIEALLNDPENLERLKKRLSI
ncbi:MAG: 4Fe-4S dicluster domain-containing protein [Kiritimatiellia bacterium]